MVIVTGVGIGEDCECDDILSFIFLYLFFKKFRVCSISYSAKSSFLIRGSRINGRTPEICMGQFKSTFF
ncbi:unnamed protein product [Rhizophagus irregularis]|nr:unnamed protein product [Rhizophagus irregularis]